MIKVYYKNEGIRATTGYWLFDNMEAAKPTIEAYEIAKQENPVLFGYEVEEVEDEEDGILYRN